MLSLFRKFMPREDRFFDLFEQHSRTVVGAAEALRSALAGGPDLQKHCDRIVELEDQADNITRNGASIITRTIFAMTAELAASGPTERAAATTWATSWMVDPT